MWEPFDKVADTRLLLHTAAAARFGVSYSGTGQCVCVSKLDLSRRCGMFFTRQNCFFTEHMYQCCAATSASWRTCAQATRFYLGSIPRRDYYFRRYVPEQDCTKIRENGSTKNNFIFAENALDNR